MVSHPDNQYRRTTLIESAESVLAGGMYLGDDVFALCNLVRPVVLIPFDPVFPHLYDLFAVKLSSNAEASDGIDIGVEVLLFVELFVVSFEDLEDFLLIGCNLSVLAVANADGVAS